MASATRAWLVAHYATPAAMTMVIGTAMLCAGRDRLLPAVGSTAQVPLWQLVPAMLAISASLATVNRLPEARGSGRVAVARAAWLLTTVSFAAGCARILDLRTGLTTIVPGTCLLVALTFAASTVLGRGSVWVGAAAAIAIILHTGSLADVENPWTPTHGTVWLAGTALAVLGCAVFGLHGPLKQP